MGGGSYFILILLLAIISNNFACQTAVFSHAVAAAFCKIFKLNIERNESSLSKRITASASYLAL